MTVSFVRVLVDVKLDVPRFYSLNWLWRSPLLRPLLRPRAAKATQDGVEKILASTL